MGSTGINGYTGKLSYSWDHTRESVLMMLKTELASRVERRDLGSRTVDDVDAPQNLDRVMDIVQDVIEAIEPREVRGSIYGEPRFELRKVRTDASTPGHVFVQLEGIEYPNGHKRDFSAGVPRTIVFSL